MIQPVTEGENQAVTATAATGRRSLPEYEDNPSLPVASQNAKIGTRRIANKAGNQCMIVSESGEILAPAGFHEVIEVDKAKFVKMYVDGVTAFDDLSAAGSKVFKFVYSFILKNPNTDRIVLSPKHVKSVAKATFERGLTELLTKEILYRSTVAYVFFLNINYMFNGDRLAMVKEYRMKASVETSKDSSQQDLPL